MVRVKFSMLHKVESIREAKDVETNAVLWRWCCWSLKRDLGCEDDVVLTRWCYRIQTAMIYDNTMHKAAVTTTLEHDGGERTIDESGARDELWRRGERHLWWKQDQFASALFRAAYRDNRFADGVFRLGFNLGLWPKQVLWPHCTTPHDLTCAPVFYLLHYVLPYFLILLIITLINLSFLIAELVFVH